MGTYGDVQDYGTTFSSTQTQEKGTSPLSRENAWPLHSRTGSFLSRGIVAIGSKKGHTREEILAASSTTVHRRAKEEGATIGKQGRAPCRARPDGPRPHSTSPRGARRGKHPSGKLTRLSCFHYKQGVCHRRNEYDHWHPRPCIHV